MNTEFSFNKMINIKRTFKQLAYISVFNLLLLGTSQANAADIGKWQKFEASYQNTTYAANPFDLTFTATFTHTQTSTKVTQLGFYAGNDTWKIFFMPTLLGEWTYVTSSTDSDLSGKTGSLNSVASGLPGRLKPSGNRWVLEESNKAEAPIIIPTRQWFKSTDTQNGISNFINWADNTVKARLIGTTLVYFLHEQAAVPYIKGKEGVEFNIPMWDRLNDHFDTMRDRGMGFYIMLYSDDAESPNNHGVQAQSEAEIRLLRYLVARFSAYPIVLWDSGIDIGETRTNSWIDWFADWMNSNDPYGHPVSSRVGGGSGGKTPNNAGFISDGAETLPEHTSLVSTWNAASRPIIFTDRWREDGGRGGFNRTKIRRAVWEAGLVGGTGVYISGNDNGGYLTTTYQSDFKAAPDVGIASAFFRDAVRQFGQLEPRSDLLSSGNAVLSAVPGKEYVAYLSAGGSVQISLAAGSYQAYWLNPRTGAKTQITGFTNVFNASDSQDWVLHIHDGSAIVIPDIITPTNVKLNITRPTN